MERKCHTYFLEKVIVKEAVVEPKDLTAVLRKPGDRWNFARAIDEKFDQPRYKYKLNEEKEEKPKKVNPARNL